MSQTVCTRELLINGGILKLALYLKKLEIDEMRIMEPLPCGALKNKLKEVLTDNEKEQLKQLHITLNRDSRYPKAKVSFHILKVLNNLAVELDTAFIY